VSRYAWYAADWPVQMRELADRLRELAFTSASTEGFVVERSRDQSLDATYLRKVVSSEPRLDPFGQVIAQQEVSYQQVPFLASSDGIGLELVDAPRATQRFVSKLLEVCDFRLTIKPLNVDVERWASQIASQLDVEGVFEAIQISGIDLGQGTTAKVTARGRREVLASVKRFVPVPHVVERLQVRLEGAYKGSTLVLGHLGTAKVSAKDELELHGVLRSTLLASLRLAEG